MLLLFTTLSSQFLRNSFARVTLRRASGPLLYVRTHTRSPPLYKVFLDARNPLLHSIRTDVGQLTRATVMADNKYCVEYAKRGTAGCKKCKQKIEKGLPRIAKVVANPFSEEGGDMKLWHHVSCMFETFIKARATTKVIEDPEDLEGWENMEQADKDTILQLIKERAQRTPKKATPKKTPQKSKKDTENAASGTKVDSAPAATTPTPAPAPAQAAGIPEHKDNSFKAYRRLCALVAEESSYLGKTALVAKYVSKGRDGDSFKGDTYLLIKLLLPGQVKRVYNLQNKQLVKLFSQIFGTSLEEMVTDLEQGDVAETVFKFFELSTTDIQPAAKSTLTLAEVDHLLGQLAAETKEDDQERVLTRMAKRSTANDLKMIIRLIKHDLRINAGSKHILEGLDANAYPAFQASRDLRDVVDRVLKNQREARETGKPGMAKSISVRASLMTPVLPMLAEPCKSVEFALKRCPSGMYSEIKYDGERVQVHKQGDRFSYFSRSLKPVLAHKVQHFKEFIPRAFPHGKDMILDAEVLLIDTNTGKPLPFGTLGVHKKSAFKDAAVCLFVFDCLHFNGENLMETPIKERRKFLHDNMTEVPNHVMFSEMKFVTTAAELRAMITRAIREGLEGLVLKDITSIYEPGKRHWLKVKKDYLNEGAMADAADLAVLGAYYGSGSKGGMMSVFLMGTYDPHSGKWCTVTKCSGGHDDKTLERLNKELPMIKISKDQSKVPKWLKINKVLIPDFVISDPKVAPVWEIVGAEFSKSESHTADGISIRFPRVTRIRDDKDWETATNLNQLRDLFEKSKETSDIADLFSPGTKKKPSGNDDDDDDDAGRGMQGSDVGSSASSSRTSTPAASPLKRKIKEDPESISKKKRKLEGETTNETSPMKKRTPEKKQRSEKSHKHGSSVKLSEVDKQAGLPSIFRGVKLCISSGRQSRAKTKCGDTSLI
ncbi:PREDICTED: DNA ligase 3-like [Priapulus caudatus]|uniref:DNA ligase n=1 Tax=Priapulus caudatus TaxID=37621 RepID=A0ABM1DVB4_PRICU|nr:PREDICTED: DNA ligase 3-like [Priapulus caudatus]